MNQTVLVLDFGGQYKDLIARRVRELGVHSVVRRGDLPLDKIREIDPIGIIFTGGPDSVYAENAPACADGLFDAGIPILGICYGMQLMMQTLGGKVQPGKNREFGALDITVTAASPLFEGFEGVQSVLMSHTDQVQALPSGFKTLASSPDCTNAAAADDGRRLYGLQFHPEVELTKNGTLIIKNFLYNICRAAGDYNVTGYIETQLKDIREVVGNEKVLLGLSGGVDSAVCAALIGKAIGKKLYCIFVDHGLMRKDEGDQIEEVFSKRNLNFIRVNAKDLFLSELKGVTDPETKRKIIGREFINVFRAEAKKLGEIKFLAQGTIYPDIIESGVSGSAVIKSHHNVGGLPKDIGFAGIIEPLRGLFKDEVRKVGRELKLPPHIVNRQPFPGPGLGVRCIGEITEEKLSILREADAIFREEMDKAKVKADQYFAVLTDLKSVGVMGDFRTYDYTLALRAVKTSDFMTCEYVKVPHPVLERASKRIVNAVPKINRIVYDITGKPPATIEWE